MISLFRVFRRIRIICLVRLISRISRSSLVDKISRMSLIRLIRLIRVSIGTRITHISRITGSMIFCGMALLLLFMISIIVITISSMCLLLGIRVTVWRRGLLRHLDRLPNLIMIIISTNIGVVVFEICSMLVLLLVFLFLFGLLFVCT